MTDHRFVSTLDGWGPMVWRHTCSVCGKSMTDPEMIADGRQYSGHQFQAALEKRMNELDDDGWECEAHVYPYQGGGTLGAVIVAKKLNTSP